MQREKEDVRSRRTTGPARVRGSPEIIVTILRSRDCQGLLQPQGQAPVPRMPYFELPLGSPAALVQSTFGDIELGHATKYSQLEQKESYE
ncbi:unnamed protein product [Larinioides sclopetarius]|uniref:Uncharacterized protein n=1 Tax=Larinioides sclopetarius TaxID=280406 RepID=A0AAV2ARF9_9ARAC